MKLNIRKKYLVIGLAFVLLMALSPVAMAGLPPRPTATPIPASKSDSRAPQGAHIVLITQPGQWTVVQWQDVNGDWQDVEGWRGTADGGRVEWWVAQKDFGTGPFRWAVGQSADGGITSASEPFHLPAAPNETLTVTAP